MLFFLSLCFVAPDGPPDNFTFYFDDEYRLQHIWKQPGMDVEYWNTNILKNQTWKFLIATIRIIEGTSKFSANVSNGQYFNKTLEEEEFTEIFCETIFATSNGKMSTFNTHTCIVPPLRQG